MTVTREAIVRKIAGNNDQAVRMGLLFNRQTREPSETQADTVDLKTQSAIGIMSASGMALADSEESALHLLDGLGWSNQQVGSFLQALAEGS